MTWLASSTWPPPAATASDASAGAPPMAGTGRAGGGAAGVGDVRRVIAHHEPVAAREVGRLAELPVPIVAAVCNELRKRGVVDRARPVRLTPAGRAGLAMPAAGRPGISGECPGCGGTGVAIPAGLAALPRELELAAAGMPSAKLGLGQTHLTADTKLH